MMIYLVPIAISVAVLVGFVGVLELTKGRRRVPDRLQAIQEGRLDEVSPDLLDQPLPFHWRIASLLGWLLPHLLNSEDLRWQLAMAGYRRPEARGLFTGAKAIMAIGLGSATALIASGVRMDQTGMLMLTAAMALLGFQLPSMWLLLKQTARQKKIIRSLPDALDLMVICVQAGQGLNAAIVSVEKEIQLHSPELSDELHMVNREMRAGLARSAALRNLANRTGVDDVRALAAVLIQSDRLGTSIAKALRIHAESLRTKRRQRAEESARKTAVKLVFPLVLCIFPELLVVILAPGMIMTIRALIDTAK